MQDTWRLCGSNRFLFLTDRRRLRVLRLVRAHESSDISNMAASGKAEYDLQVGRGGKGEPNIRASNLPCKSRKRIYYIHLNTLLRMTNIWIIAQCRSCKVVYVIVVCIFQEWKNGNTF